jgi:pyruvate formate lyase activating enzyme
MTDIIGNVHSIQSLGTLDGPGVRFVVFLQGCNLHCGCCHNPDTRDYDEKKLYTPPEIIKMARRYKEYFGTEGGITISGGEPLLQAQFVRDVFALAKAEGIRTCLDTSGSILNEHVKEMLDLTDYVLLDIKYVSDELYRRHVGCSIDVPLKFLEYLNEKGIKTTVRQVTIPTLNDDIESVKALKELTRGYTCVEKIELLPFKKICQVKYDQMGLVFPLGHLPTPSAEKMRELQNIIDN